ncbi:hypothetical protein B0H12DRAFT_1109195 [Mycena haematopus]|nr:hypothetical protein B0H12DRAFT_1109195 [Mycena haematopus]
MRSERDCEFNRGWALGRRCSFQQRVDLRMNLFLFGRRMCVFSRYPLGSRKIEYVRLSPIPGVHHILLTSTSSIPYPFLAAVVGLPTFVFSIYFLFWKTPFWGVFSLLAQSFHWRVWETSDMKLIHCHCLFICLNPPTIVLIFIIFG